MVCGADPCILRRQRGDTHLARCDADIVSDSVKPHLRSALRSTRRPLRRGRWRSWVAWWALVTLAWPSLGPLPWAARDVAAEAYTAAHQTDEPAAGPLPAAYRHDGNASDIPGSPTHPADHDCFQCQVLKHLARCVPAQLDPPAIPVQWGCPVRPGVHVEAQRTGLSAFLPPVRAPPLRGA
jgi:hypothetical protein